MNWSKLTTLLGKLAFWRRKPAVPPPQPVSQAPPGNVVALARHQLRVLLVDIDPKTHYSISRHMRALGHEMVGVCEWDQGIKVAQQWVPNLIIYGDLHWPKQAMFAHFVLGNHLRNDNWPMPNRPYLVRLWPEWDETERMLSFEFGFDTFEEPNLGLETCRRWCEETREMMRNRYPRI